MAAVSLLDLEPNSRTRLGPGFMRWVLVYAIDPRILEPVEHRHELGLSRQVVVPDEVVDDLVVHGSPEECREKIQRYVENGVDTPVLAILPLGMDSLEAARVLAPR